MKVLFSLLFISSIIYNSCFNVHRFDQKQLKRIDFVSKFAISAKVSQLQTWRVFNVEVCFQDDPGKDITLMHPSLQLALEKKIKFRFKEDFYSNNVTIVKKAFDGRRKKNGQPRWIYTIDLTLSMSNASTVGLKNEEGKVELLTKVVSKPSGLINLKVNVPKIVIVGAGPSGLFAAIKLVNAGIKPIIIERGFPVEVRGRDIGALFNRKILNPDSNLCYGEGGAGTWSDGKLTTRIGKNSESVR
jgi:hypothetical protein